MAGQTRSLISLLVLGFLLAAALPQGEIGAKKKYRPYTVLPTAGTPTRMGPGVEIVEIQRAGVYAEVSYVGAYARQRMLEATLGVRFDPFATPPGQPRRFHTFLLFLENRSSEPVLFNPSTARMRTNKEDHTYALDYSFLYEALGRNGRINMEDLAKVVFDRPVRLDPGGKAKKLLVFQELPEQRWKEFRLLVSLEQDGTQSVDMSVNFRKVYLDEKG